jgi:hypothetical protein
MISKIIKTLSGALFSYKKIDLMHYREQNDYKHPKVNLGQIQASMNASKSNIRGLGEVEFQVFSQYGDDGIIQFLLSKIPFVNKTFIEFGVENYREANTRFLLINNYWSGMVIDGDPKNIQHIQNEDIYGYYDLRAYCSFITKENINQLLHSSGFHSEVGILSIDVDGNDYWIWNEISAIQPEVVICEYNSLFGFELSVTIPYEPSFVRGNGKPLFFYGMSLNAAVQLAQQKGYFFIGCNSAGNNAYFINKKHKDLLGDMERSTEAGYNLAIFSESKNEEGNIRRGKDKIMAIDNMEVIDLNNGNKIKIDAAQIVTSLQKAEKFKGIH